jgi:hypothetical protein
MTGDNIDDLFSTDKRLTLKPVVDLGRYLKDAFVGGDCACCRCQASGGNEADYKHSHTFTLSDGTRVNRRFAPTSASDVLQAVKKAWLSYFKEEMPVVGPFNMTAASAFLEPNLVERLTLLVHASGLGEMSEGQMVLRPVIE